MRIAAVACTGVLQPPNRSNATWDIADEASLFAGVCVYKRRHWHNAMQLAGELAHGQDFDRIFMWAHSRGAKFECKCCECLKGFGRPVKKLVFADGWNGSGELLVPANVFEVEAWHQSEFKPQGSRIVLESSATKLTLHEAPRGTKHAAMDELPGVRAAVLDALRG